MNQAIKLLDVVALLEAMPEKNLARGEVGTVVEIVAPGVCDVEFCDDAGRAYASAALRETQLILLSLDSSSEAEIREDWLMKAYHRAQDLDEGKVQPVPAEEVRRKAKALLR